MLGIDKFRNKKVIIGILVIILLLLLIFTIYLLFLEPLDTIKDIIKSNTLSQEINYNNYSNNKENFNNVDIPNLQKYPYYENVKIIQIRNSPNDDISKFYTLALTGFFAYDEYGKLINLFNPDIGYPYFSGAYNIYTTKGSFDSSPYWVLNNLLPYFPNIIDRTTSFNPKEVIDIFKASYNYKSNILTRTIIDAINPNNNIQNYFNIQTINANPKIGTNINNSINNPPPDANIPFTWNYNNSKFQSSTSVAQNNGLETTSQNVSYWQYIFKNPVNISCVEAFSRAGCCPNRIPLSIYFINSNNQLISSYKQTPNITVNYNNNDDYYNNIYHIFLPNNSFIRPEYPIKKTEFTFPINILVPFQNNKVISPPVENDKLIIQFAKYGSFVDISVAIRKQQLAKNTNFKNSYKNMGGDPCYGIDKQLIIIDEINQIFSYIEDSIIDLTKHIVIKRAYYGIFVDISNDFAKKFNPSLNSNYQISVLNDQIIFNNINTNNIPISFNFDCKTNPNPANKTDSTYINNGLIFGYNNKNQLFFNKTILVGNNNPIITDMGYSNLWNGYLNLENSLTTFAYDFARYTGNYNDSTLYISLDGDKTQYSLYEVIKNNENGQPYTKNSNLSYSLYNPNNNRTIYLLTDLAVNRYNKLNSTNYPYPNNNKATIISPPPTTSKAIINTQRPITAPTITPTTTTPTITTPTTTTPTTTQFNCSNYNNNLIFPNSQLSCNTKDNCYYANGNCYSVSDKLSNIKNLKCSYIQVPESNKYKLSCFKNDDNNYIIKNISYKQCNDLDRNCNLLLTQDNLQQPINIKNYLVALDTTTQNFIINIDKIYKTLYMTDINDNTISVNPTNNIIQDKNEPINMIDNNALVEANINANDIQQQLDNISLKRI
jgi:hypothetical protein